MSFMGIKRVVYTSGVNEPSDELPLSFFLSLSLSLSFASRAWISMQANLYFYEYNSKLKESNRNSFT